MKVVKTLVVSADTAESIRARAYSESLKTHVEYQKLINPEYRNFREKVAKLRRRWGGVHAKTTE